MIKTILVPASGSDTDAVVFDTALAAARPCRAHLEFFHLRVSSGAALRYTPHVGFARGKALHNVLQDLHKEAEQRSKVAEQHMRDFCQRHKITVADAPASCQLGPIALPQALPRQGASCVSCRWRTVRRGCNFCNSRWTATVST